MSQEILDDTNKTMAKAVEHTLHEFSTLHTGKASPSHVSGATRLQRSAAGRRRTAGYEGRRATDLVSPEVDLPAVCGGMGYDPVRRADRSRPWQPQGPQQAPPPSTRLRK